MTNRTCVALVMTFLTPYAASAAGTVTLDLASPSAGTTVTAGSTITWSVSASVSASDNAGLALVLVDLVQAAGNPAQLDLPQAGAAPAGMEGFEMPAGISNPLGYGGTPSGPAGAMNLKQIGGAQNTFGVPGGSFGLDVNVDGGIGQAAPQMIASGSFAAPSTPGMYQFRITNGVANTLDSVNAAPAFSPASAATVVMGSSTISFTVGVDCPGDLDGDLDVDLADLATLLSHFGQATGASGADGDIDGDADVDLADLAQLLANFGNVCS